MITFDKVFCVFEGLGDRGLGPGKVLGVLRIPQLFQKGSSAAMESAFALSGLTRLRSDKTLRRRHKSAGK